MTVTLSPLDYYARNRCALFPIPAGSKNPTGIVASFKQDHSSDPAQWAAWRQSHPGCNFGIVAFASRLIIVDIDTKIGRDEAWAAWHQLCHEWGIPTPSPHCQSARGGWHAYFTVPPEVDPAKLRQPDAIKKIINVRCIGYTVAAGSVYNDPDTGQALPYSLLTDAPPYPAPVALIEHCTRKPAPARSTATPPGSLDPAGTSQLVTWLTERGEFAAYEDWVSVGMAIKLEFGDAGFPIWELTFDETVTPDTASTKWDSFATEPDSHSVTLLTFMSRAHKLGWKGSIARTAASMFGDVVSQLATASGATLPGAGPVPMMAGQEELARLATPLLESFLALTTDAPSAPSVPDLPTLPPQMAGHGLYALMQSSLLRIFALAELPKLKAQRLNDPLGVLHVLQPDVFDATCRRLQNGEKAIKLELRQIKNISANLAEEVERVTVTHEKWEYDKNGLPESDNPDNVVVLLDRLSLQVRWNRWLERMEIQGGADPDLLWPTWTYVDDTIVAKLLTRARRTKTRFRPGKDFLWETLISFAHQNSVDPVLETLDALAAAWDRQPRLITWLTRYCGTPCDPLHQAYGKLIFGGIVKRAREPGCKFDFMPVFYGPQGTGKSSLLAIMAFRPEWFTDTVLLGDASKELVLSLAGKLVVEISEMGMRGNTNANHVKAMITRPIDSGRTAYARAVTERARRNIFCGTTNDSSPLEDPTGNRRFLPIHITQEIDLAAFRRDIGQLLGEAAALNTSAELPRELWEAAAQHQEAARAPSDLEVHFNDWFGGDVECFVTQPNTVKLCSAIGRKNAGQLVHPIMKRLGFRLLQPYINGRKTHCWVRSAVEMKPKHILKLPECQVDVSMANNPRVMLRMATPTVPFIPNR